MKSRILTYSRHHHHGTLLRLEIFLQMFEYNLCWRGCICFANGLGIIKSLSKNTKSFQPISVSWPHQQHSQYQWNEQFTILKRVFDIFSVCNEILGLWYLITLSFLYRFDNLRDRKQCCWKSSTFLPYQSLHLSTDESEDSLHANVNKWMIVL